MDYTFPRASNFLSLAFLRLELQDNIRTIFYPFYARGHFELLVSTFFMCEHYHDHEFNVLTAELLSRGRNVPPKMPITLGNLDFFVRELCIRIGAMINI